MFVSSFSEKLLSEDRRAHAALNAAVVDARRAVRGLAEHPEDAALRGRTARAFRLVSHAALGHMAREERHLFPQALLDGMPPESVVALIDDHTALRRLARRIEQAGFDGTSDHDVEDVADWFGLFLNILEGHLVREEETLHHFVLRNA